MINALNDLLVYYYRCSKITRIYHLRTTRELFKYHLKITRVSLKTTRLIYNKWLDDQQVTHKKLKEFIKDIWKKNYQPKL